MKTRRIILVSLVTVAFATAALAQGDFVDFDTSRWARGGGAKVVDHLGRKSLMGNAYLPDVAFENGVIEVDIAVTGERSYPGIVFRAWSEEDCEHIYIRPHRAGLYSDAVQYAPKIKSIGSWQLCNGPGYTASAEFPTNEWMHVRLEVKGTQARLFIDDMQNPALAIDGLQHGVSEGSIGLEGPADGTAYFSNFRYEACEDLVFDRPAVIHMPPGTITDWEISPAYKISDVDAEKYPGAAALKKVEWRKAECEPDGIVNVARYCGRTGREPDCVMTRATIRSEKEQTRKYLIGYSDAVSVFLNGEILFTGESAYQQRDPSFLGIIGLFDAVYLPLERGDNELLLMVTESFGGWGFVCRDPEATFVGDNMERIWETAADFLFPESAVYDRARNVVYVSGYDMYNRAGESGGQFISKVSPEGKVVEKEWLKGLQRPTGMVIVGDTLVVVERGGLVKIDLETGEVAMRHPCPGARFPNDVVADGRGNLYISDSRRSVIFRFARGAFEEWLSAPAISEPNGLFVSGNYLVVGSCGDNALKGVDLATKKVSVIARLEPGTIDGIKSDRNGDFIVSHAEGRIYRITRAGAVTTLLDTTGPNHYTADFDVIAEKDLLVIPTFVDNRVVAYRLK